MAFAARISNDYIITAIRTDEPSAQKRKRFCRCCRLTARSKSCISNGTAGTWDSNEHWLTLGKMAWWRGSSLLVEKGRPGVALRRSVTEKSCLGPFFNLRGLLFFCLALFFITPFPSSLPSAICSFYSFGGILQQLRILYCSVRIAAAPKRYFPEWEWFLSLSLS